MQDDIDRCNRLVRECIMGAATSVGFKRWMYLKFAAFFTWASDLGREIQREEQHGDNDNYHDEY